MFTSISLKNFRCFKSLRLNELKPINIVVGNNGSGKTALLEALVLGLRAHPSAAQFLNQSRGLPIPGVNAPGVQVFFGPANLMFSASWDHFFHGGDPKNNPISMEFEDQQANGKTIYKLSISQSRTLSPITADNSGLPFSPVVPPLIFDRSTNRKASEKIQVLANAQNQTHIVGAPNFYYEKILFFDQSTKPNETENVAWLSQLKIRNASAIRYIEKVLAEAFHGFSGLEILSPTANQAIWASLGDGTTRPLALISAGLHKIITLLIAASWNQDGVLIIDEIENGIYYEKYEILWKALIEICKKNNNQLFVSSHSIECLRSLSSIVREEPERFSLLRASKNFESFDFDQFQGALFADAINSTAEIRGVSA